jgi:PhnB protein
MKQTTQPYFHFDRNCREAMEFYQQLFGGQLEIMTIGESPAKEHFSKDLYDEIMHSNLTNGDFCIMASDMCGMGELKPGNSVNINLNCSSEEEINHLYKQLSEEGIILQELQPQFWGALFAMVTDRFGVRWMLSLEQEK